MLSRNLRLFLILPGILFCVYAARLVLQPEPARAALRSAEALWQSGRILEARQALAKLAETEPAPVIRVRLAEAELLRGECAAAQREAGAALQLDASMGLALRRDEAALAHLVAGQCGILGGDERFATAELAAVDPRSPQRSVVELLRGEAALRGGQRAVAVENAQTALALGLREPARSFAHLRIALSTAATEPALARRHLAAIPDALPAPAADLRPFLPLDAAAIVREARGLEAIAAADAAQRDQLLGQRLLELGLPRLAIERFEAVSDDAPAAVLARAYAGLARYQLGQRDAALEQLRELNAAVPEDAAVATMYATLLVERGQLDAADAALSGAEAQNPLDPAIALVRSDILASRSEYPAAVAERRRAFEIAEPAVRARYARALADLHLRLTYQTCGPGVEAARAAVELESSAPSWQSLAALLYHCRDYVGAADAARRGLQRAANEPALEYYLGAALWESDQRIAGAAHLRAAADLAPASQWRRQSEVLLGE